MVKRILIVEGITDKEFFSLLLKSIDLGNVEVVVNTPQDLMAAKDGKNSAIGTLINLIPQLNDGSITNLALIVDADYAQDDWGFEKTKNKVIREVKKHGFIDEPKDGCFSHPDGLNPVGLWVMPNNKSDGMFEDWLKGAVIHSERPLLDKAVSVISALTPKKFKDIHRSKAEIGTWSSWQKIPDYGPKIAIKESLIDINYSGLIDWLKRVYS